MTLVNVYKNVKYKLQSCALPLFMCVTSKSNSAFSVVTMNISLVLMERAENNHGVQGGVLYSFDVVIPLSFVEHRF